MNLNREECTIKNKGKRESEEYTMCHFSNEAFNISYLCAENLSLFTSNCRKYTHGLWNINSDCQESRDGAANAALHVGKESFFHHTSTVTSQALVRAAVNNGLLALSGRRLRKYFSLTYWHTLRVITDTFLFLHQWNYLNTSMPHPATAVKNRGPRSRAGLIG